MITEFQLIDMGGKILAHGEIDDDVYRVFSNASEYEEFEKLEDMLAAWGAHAMQPNLFQTPPRPRQLSIQGRK